MTDIVKMEVDKETVENIINTQISSAIVREFEGSKNDLLERVIQKILTSKVDSQGKPSRYSSRSDMNLTEWLSQKTIIECAESALKQFFEKQKPAIEKSLLQHLNRNKNTFVKACISAMEQSFTKSFRWNVKVGVYDKDE